MSNSDQWPVDPASKKPLPPRAQPGYYPGFSTLSQQNFWDDATRTVVLHRVNEQPPIRFFSPKEADLMQAISERVMPQDDRDAAHKIPLINGIDQRLYEKRSDGYRYESMPDDPEAYQLGLKGVDSEAQQRYAKPFTELGPLEQDTVLKALHDAKPEAGKEIWERMPVHRFWLLLVQDILEQYYAHPFAWDEIGFGGPAYPRAYMRLERGEPEPWEVSEQRYEWEAPPNSLSSQVEQIAGTSEHMGKPGEGGTH